MKRVRMFFATITAVAAISGTLAFKTQSFGTGTLRCTSNELGTGCTATKDFIDQTSGGAISYCTSSLTDACTTQYDHIIQVITN